MSDPVIVDQLHDDSTRFVYTFREIGGTGSSDEHSIDEVDRDFSDDESPDVFESESAETEGGEGGKGGEGGEGGKGGEVASTVGIDPMHIVDGGVFGAGLGEGESTERKENRGFDDEEGEIRRSSNLQVKSGTTDEAEGDKDEIYNPLVEFVELELPSHPTVPLSEEINENLNVNDAKNQPFNPIDNLEVQYSVDESEDEEVGEEEDEEEEEFEDDDEDDDADEDGAENNARQHVDEVPPTLSIYDAKLFQKAKEVLDFHLLDIPGLDFDEKRTITDLISRISSRIAFCPGFGLENVEDVSANDEWLHSGETNVNRFGFIVYHEFRDIIRQRREISDKPLTYAGPDNKWLTESFRTDGRITPVIQTIDSLKKRNGGRNELQTSYLTSEELDAQSTAFNIEINGEEVEVIRIKQGLCFRRDDHEDFVNDVRALLRIIVSAGGKPMDGKLRSTFNAAQRKVHGRLRRGIWPGDSIFSFIEPTGQTAQKSPWHSFHFKWGIDYYRVVWTLVSREIKNAPAWNSVKPKKQVKPRAAKRGKPQAAKKKSDPPSWGKSEAQYFRSRVQRLKERFIGRVADAYQVPSAWYRQIWRKASNETKHKVIREPAPADQPFKLPRRVYRPEFPNDDEEDDKSRKPRVSNDDDDDESSSQETEPLQPRKRVPRMGRTESMKRKAERGSDADGDLSPKMTKTKLSLPKVIIKRKRNGSSEDSDVFELSSVNEELFDEDDREVEKDNVERDDESDMSSGEAEAFVGSKAQEMYAKHLEEEKKKKKEERKKKKDKNIRAE